MPLFALTLLVASSLLFCVQPMAARRALPLFGGSPAVWTTCMLFFQATLLAGYGYAHLVAARLGVRRQAALHAALVVLSLASLPWMVALELSPPPPGESPSAWLLGLLAVMVGGPTFVLAATAPLLQRWFAATEHRAARDPYFLYGASNLGSLAALLAYPLLIEQRWPLASQARGWMLGYQGLAVLLIACAVVSWRSGPGESARVAPSWPRGRDLLAWLGLAFVPSSLMLGVTTYLSTDIAAVPLLWVVPLALYLVSFIVAFARRPIVSQAAARRALPLVVMLLVPVLGVGMVQAIWIPLHLLALFLAALVCHGELARRRPSAGQLTAFYLALAVGGALGGLFNALVAPRVFDRVAEYPLALVLACLAAAGAADQGSGRLRRSDVLAPLAIFVLGALLVRDVGGLSKTVAGVFAVMAAAGLAALVGWTHRRRPWRFALGVGAALATLGLSTGVDGRTLLRERNFFGVLRVSQDDAGRFRRLFHGSTLHGQQSLEPGRALEPLAYFDRTGPMGDVFAAFHRGQAPRAVAVAGLGAGSLAGYAEPGERWTFYEIDPAVARIAADPRYFTFLSDCRARPVAVVIGDARLQLQKAPEDAFGLIVLDAFSSDAPPVHLLTREAVGLYRSRLADGGLVAVNISNRYLDLDSVVGALARAEGLACRVRYDVDLTAAQRKAGKLASAWAVLAARDADLGPIANDPAWVAPRARPGVSAWTDDFSNLAGSFVLGGLKPRRGPAPPAPTR